MTARNQIFEEKNLFVGAVTYLPEISGKKIPNTELGKHSLSLDKTHFSRDIFTIADAIKDMIEDKESGVWRTQPEIAKTFLVKRLAFDHESEIRLVYVDGEIDKTTDGAFKIKIDPMKLISSIQFDPRMKDDVYLSLRKAVNASTGSFRIRMSKSDLYKSPEKLASKS